MGSLLGDIPEGIAFVISAPAGTGKTTLAHKLVKEFPNVVASISYTTRSPRSGEIDGKDYHFITKTEFESRIEASDFLEYAELYGIYYGTSRRWIAEQQKQGKHVLLVIDTQGAMQLKGKFPAVFIFIRAPSLNELKKRLILRGTEDLEMINKRLEWASTELQIAAQYDYQIVNDNLSTAYQVLKSIVVAECHRTERNAWPVN